MGQGPVLIGVLAAIAMSTAVTWQAIAADEKSLQRSCGEYHRMASNDDRRTDICDRLRRFWHGYATRFGTFDKNDDGIVSAEEASDNAEEVFQSMDLNEDDRVTLHEFMDNRMGHRKALINKRQLARWKENETWFVKMDIDRDTNLSRPEFFAAARRHYLESDTNKDSKVTPWEFRAQRGIF